MFRQPPSAACVREIYGTRPSKALQTAKQPNTQTFKEPNIQTRQCRRQKQKTATETASEQRRQAKRPATGGPGINGLKL